MAVMDNQKMIERLNDLIALDYDAVGAYEAAIDRIHEEFLRMRLREFQLDHRRHIQDLSIVVERMGGKARERPDVKGFLLKGFTAVTALMGTEAALRAMQGNERLTNSTYRKAMEQEWTDDVRQIIDRNFHDEQRHLAFIEESLRTRSWEQTGMHP
ncbi:DUF2383 domain-containing protein [Hyalangium rubrum]|uniref:DUF2383 domain-containing protein n=1 Tax=Hyalangium rubrum TaxID=3103134 RepID=A0ABU5H4I4_9BACT|nr:DUF2383 domain-containing protein [Hyalangium sp. s54d21]MDY7228392.1 DUF2383 domain-containing protein [Hyalangium sp. s54d21]